MNTQQPRALVVSRAPRIFFACLLTLAGGHAFAGSANPMMAPPPSVKVEPSLPGAHPPMPPAPALMPIGGNAQAHGALSLPPPGQDAEGAVAFPAEKWLAQAVVSSTVGARASIVVPLTLNEALAANSMSNTNPALRGQFSAPPFNPNILPSGSSTGADSSAGQPQSATQQVRHEILYVQTGKPFFFKGEKFAVEVSGNEVTIWRPVKGMPQTADRDIIFIGAVSSTEMVRKPIVSAYATSDPSVLKRITPVYSASTSVISNTATAPAVK